MQLKKKRDLENPDENWLVSYSDMMTLLLYIFVILYAMAVTNEGKVTQTIRSFYTAFEDRNIISIFDSSSGEPVNGLSIGNDYDSYNQINKFIKENNLGSKVAVKRGSSGITLEIQNEILFDPGSAVIKPENIEILSKISVMLKKLSNNVIIEGHTDNIPINTGYYSSNWELSSDRAVKVLRYFTDSCGLIPERFQATGYGQYKPIADNNTPEGRQKNRRVDIIIEGTKE